MGRGSVTVCLLLRVELHRAATFCRSPGSVLNRGRFTVSDVLFVAWFGGLFVASGIFRDAANVSLGGTARAVGIARGPDNWDGNDFPFPEVRRRKSNVLWHGAWAGSLGVSLARRLDQDRLVCTTGTCVIFSRFGDAITGLPLRVGVPILGPEHLLLLLFCSFLP